MCNTFMLRWSCGHSSECRKSTCRGTIAYKPATSRFHHHHCKIVDPSSALRTHMTSRCGPCEKKHVRKHWNDEMTARDDAVNEADKSLRMALKSGAASLSDQSSARLRLHEAVTKREVSSGLRDLALIDIRYLPSRKLWRRPKSQVKICGGSPLKREFLPEDLEMTGTVMKENQNADGGMIFGPTDSEVVAQTQSGAAREGPQDDTNKARSLQIHKSATAAGSIHLSDSRRRKSKDTANKSQPRGGMQTIKRATHAFDPLNEEDEEYYTKLQADLMNMSRQATSVEPTIQPQTVQGTQQSSEDTTMDTGMTNATSNDDYILTFGHHQSLDAQTPRSMELDTPMAELPSHLTEPQSSGLTDPTFSKSMMPTTSYGVEFTPRNSTDAAPPQLLDPVSAHPSESTPLQTSPSQSTSPQGSTIRLTGPFRTTNSRIRDARHRLFSPY